MSYSQSIDLILMLAVQVEEEGFIFYTKLARMTRNPAVKAVFLSLSQDEQMHKIDLLAIGHALSGHDKTYHSSVDMTGLIHGMLDRLKSAFKGSEPMNIDDLDLSRALSIGIENEKASVQVYKEMVCVFPAGSRGVLEKILEEEERHLEKLLDYKTSRLA